ncbi:MAG: hypothetical protein Q9172_000581 [Xanthocarpia lactea]
MRVGDYLTVALAVSGIFPGHSAALMLPPKQLDPTPAVNVTAIPLSERGLNLYCRSSAEDNAFFAPTKENWRSSGAGEKYKNFAASMVKHPEWAGRKTEPYLFAKMRLGREGFECGVGLRGCTLRPTCDEVLTVLGDRDEARWVWFVLQSMHHLTLVSSVIDEQTVRTQVDLLSLAESAAHTFYWKYDEAVVHKCKILAGLIKAAIMSAFVFLALLVPESAPAIAGGVGAVEATAVASSSFLATKGSTLATFGLNFGSNFPTNVGGPAIDEMQCPFANADEHLEEKARMGIKNQMALFYADYRKMVQSTNSDILEGVTVNRK